MVEVSVVDWSCWLCKDGGRCGVGRAYVGGFTKVYLGQCFKVNY